MADKPLFHVTYPDKPSRNRPYFFGDRRYFFGARKEGEQFDWLKDTMPVELEKITAAWTFDQQWDPEDESPLEVKSIERLNEKNVILHFDEIVGIRGEVSFKTSAGTLLVFVQGKGRDRIQLKADKAISVNELTEGLQLISGEVYAVKATVTERKL